MDNIKRRLYVLLAGSLCFFLVILFLKGLSTYSNSLQNNLIFRRDISTHITEIDFVFNGGRKKILKKKNIWITDNNPQLPADSDRINEIIDILKILNTSNPISTKKQRKKEFGIIDNRLEITIDGKKTNIYVGLSDGSRNYLSLNDDNLTFEAEGFTDVFTPFDYRDLRLHMITNESEVTALHLLSPSTELSVHKENDMWMVNKKRAFRDRVDYLINNISTLRALDIVPLREELFLSPEITLSIVEKKKEKNSFIVQKDSESYYVRIGTSPYVYVVSGVYINDLLKTESDLTQMIN